MIRWLRFTLGCVWFVDWNSLFRLCMIRWLKFIVKVLYDSLTEIHCLGCVWFINWSSLFRLCMIRWLRFTVVGCGWFVDWGSLFRLWMIGCSCASSWAMTSFRTCQAWRSEREPLTGRISFFFTSEARWLCRYARNLLFQLQVNCDDVLVVPGIFSQAGSNVLYA